MRKEKTVQMDDQNTVERDDGSYVVKKTKKSSILAFVFCVLLAFVIWAYAEADEKRENAAVGDDAPQTDIAVTDGETAS